VRVPLLGLLLLGLWAMPAAAAHRTADPPRIVPWHLIGNIGLGMSRARVERSYGRGTVESPPTTNALVWRYRGRGGIRVEYDLGGHVAMVGTSSPAYSTRSGVQVGEAIPRGRCHRVHGPCEYRWRGLTLEDAPKDAYWSRVSSLGGNARLDVVVAVGDDDIVDGMTFTEYLQCGRSEIIVAGTCRKARSQEERFFWFPPPTGLRFCQRPGGPGDFIAASPTVSCALAAKVAQGFTCNGSRCRIRGFLCFSYWSGAYGPIEDTHHAICTDDRARRVVWDGG
jgi:hypothetical protein